MKKVIGLAMLATAAGAGAASAEGTVTANISLTSDYVFRGVSLSDNGPAVQGGFDYTTDMFYAGVWASSLNADVETDLYAGFTPSTGPIDWDLGVIGYFYPGADDDAAEFDYVELKVGASTDLTEQFTVGAAYYYSGDNYGNTGDSDYWELNAEYDMSDAISFSGAFGNQTIQNPDGVPGGALEDDYNTWNLGGTIALHGFEVDLRYHDTDIDAGSDIEAYTYGPASYDGAFVVTVGREL
ncbi:MAG: TorF family putative porin [Hyphomonadaceae bacterium]